MSEAVVRLVRLTREAGLSSQEDQWSEAFVYWFDGLMPREVRAAGEADPSLEYFESDGTPHDRVGEGFIDREAKTAISFLLQMKERC
jgi:hypothetical protein